MTKLISIVGATAFRAAAFLRHSMPPANIELVKADADDTAPLRQAFRGADIVFGMTQANMMAKEQDPTRNEEYEHGKAIIDSVISEGVNSLVFSTLDSMNTDSGGKYPGVKHFESKYKAGPPEENLSKVREVSGGYYEAQEIVSALTEATGIPARYVQLPYEYLGVEEAVQMFKGIDAFGSFNGRAELLSATSLLTTSSPPLSNSGRTADGPVPPSRQKLN
ncbi:hypothetical protein BX661DRAFT_171553 [Kickxella alabastrina]|uniref:uncharacterized protein n=1 Tax=Kickxella alabastrina TaxID=61397 RepID=UPI002220D8A6|nr:uncharacterized protein BX661DRAFT_171553 [Kickxella alabastrina]KAI7826268.1 hypothetical protein BX661DRAFT_171553 [Kickxella alabastrina]